MLLSVRKVQLAGCNSSPLTQTKTSVGTLLANSLVTRTRNSFYLEDANVTNRLLIILGIAILATAGGGCTTTDGANGNANANATTTVASQTTRTAPDGSEITTSVDANGVRTETRVIHNNPRVAKVVVTTRDGKRITTVYAPSGESKDLKDEVGDGLTATGDALADAAGWTADKAEDIAGATKEGAKTVGEKTGEAATTVGRKTAEGAKTVGEKTAEGAKKTGKAIKKAITP
jgi:hypothetical protein